MRAIREGEAPAEPVADCGLWIAAQQADAVVGFDAALYHPFPRPNTAILQIFGKRADSQHFCEKWAIQAANPASFVFWRAE